MGLAFRDGLHFCVADGHFALFDEHYDMYFGVNERQTSALHALVSHNPRTLDKSSDLQSLIDQGVLIGREGPAFASVPPKVPPPTASALRQSDKQSSASLVLGAMTQHVWTAMLIHRVPLLMTLSRLRTRVARSPQNHVLSGNPRLAAFLSTHRLISAQDQCLRSSVALMHFLLDGGYCPTLVIGVRFRPFGAHAWVQQGDCVLNDSVDHVRPYTPILVI